MDNIVRICL